MRTTETQWKVTWFPDHTDHITRTGTEAHVRRLAEEQAEFHPIIESRVVEVGEWKMES